MHDPAGVPPLIQHLIFYGVGGLIGCILRCTRRLPNVSKLKSLGDAPRRSFEEAFWQARHDAVVRLALSKPPTVVPGLISVDLEERAILSMPVFFCERRPTTRSLPFVEIAKRTMIWPHSTSGGSSLSVSPVDHGTLHLTRDEFVFASPRSWRKYPLDELAHISATRTSIALRRRGTRAVSYFGGIDATSIRFEVVPGADDRWPEIHCTFDFTGHEVLEIVNLLLSASTPAPV